MEGVEVGWAQMKIITNNEKKLVMETALLHKAFDGRVFLSC